MSAPVSPDPVTSAARWLAQQDSVPLTVIGDLKAQYGLSARQCCEALALTHRFRFAGAQADE
ncbi:hypothetical protein IFT84_13125 [Rhizobium sp. CFBP 8762]|uniref:hypothetical protein n=1 Tax=Rhizobium sp. CFBP 8762 TaxID=2775279 RepID=UPI0017830FC3|nr:hypothetical protein [Rhizobium sp. CFBP 8762]MBD8555447.1 hypothetical protein [Rhizobium sp. CFBP 8762]